MAPTFGMAWRILPRDFARLTDLLRAVIQAQLHLDSQPNISGNQRPLMRVLLPLPCFQLRLPRPITTLAAIPHQLA